VRAPARQPDHVPEVTESARRWSGYVCPDCRFVFRVPRDHDGVGIVCPSCRRLLRIPGGADAPPPLLAPVRVMESAGLEEDSGSRGSKRRRRKRSKNSISHAWEEDGRARRSSSGSFSFLPMVVGIVLLIAVIGGLIYALKPGPSAPAPPPSITEVISEPGAAERTARNLMVEAEALAGKFLNATSVEQLLPLVLNPEITGPRIHAWHADGVVDPPGLRDFNINQLVETTGSVSSVYVTTNDFSPRQLFLVETPEGLKVDWESWSGWSELPWKDFIGSKPADPKTCRVFVRKSDYYNFAFKDETKWRAYRLESADGEHVLFGYAERDSQTDKSTANSMEQDNTPMILDLKFPGNEVSRDQVIIDRFVTKGWVDPAVIGN